MIGIEELKDYSKLNNISLYHAEKEYIQYIFLKLLTSYSHDFVFKGGTCLRICYDFQRASEDLDFNTILDNKEIDIIIKKIIKHFYLYSINSEITQIKEYQGNIRYELRFEGPLYNGNKRSTNTIKIDFNKRKIYLKPEPKVISKKFSDVSFFTINSLNRKEILAEKLRALQMRVQPRDLYDVWYLFNLGIVLDKNLLIQKLNDDEISDFELKFPSKKEFDNDMNLLILEKVNYDFVVNSVKEFINKNIIN